MIVRDYLSYFIRNIREKNSWKIFRPFSKKSEHGLLRKQLLWNLVKIQEARSSIGTFRLKLLEQTDDRRSTFDLYRGFSCIWLTTFVVNFLVSFSLDTVCETSNSVKIVDRRCNHIHIHMSKTRVFVWLSPRAALLVAFTFQCYMFHWFINLLTCYAAMPC